MHKVLITTSSFSEDLIEKLQHAGLQVAINPFGRKLTEIEVKVLIEENRPIGIIAGVEPLTREVLQATGNLKVVSRCGIGMDSVDLESAREFDIFVTNTPDAPTIPVAELTLGMILALMRGIHTSDASIRQGAWVRPIGGLLHGKVIGIIGCGRIGSHLSTLLSGFGCRVVGYDPVQKESPNLEYVDLDALLEQSDVVSLHIPYSSDNHHFMDKRRIGKMKKGALLINASRGGLIDETALLESLKDGGLGGSALDSFEQEPYAGPLRELDNVLLTAHIGSYAKEGRAIMEQQAVNNLLQGLRDMKVII